MAVHLRRFCLTSLKLHPIRHRVDDPSKRSATESIKSCRYLALKRTLLILRKFVYTPCKSRIFHRVIIATLLFTADCVLLLLLLQIYPSTEHSFSLSLRFHLLLFLIFFRRDKLEWLAI